MSSCPGLIFIVSAPSGAGKTSLVKALVQDTPDLRISISHTTRGKRPQEQEGQHYYFVDEPEFMRLRQADAFIEDAKVFGHYYATSKQEIAKAIELGQVVVLDIDWQGAAQVKAHFPEYSVGVFLLPPSTAVLKDRLERRAQDHPDVIANRLAAANSEMQHYRDYDFVVINDNFDDALADLKAIVRAHRLKRHCQESRHSKLIENLLAAH